MLVASPVWMIAQPGRTYFFDSGFQSVNQSLPTHCYYYAVLSTLNRVACLLTKDLCQDLILCANESLIRIVTLWINPLVAKCHAILTTRSRLTAYCIDFCFLFSDDWTTMMNCRLRLGNLRWSWAVGIDFQCNGLLLVFLSRECLIHRREAILRVCFNHLQMTHW